MKKAATLKETIGKVKVKKKSAPVWEGPCGTGPQGGITFSLLNKWLEDKERFRLRTIEGLKARDKWNSRIEFGSMWHICEEAFAAGYAPGVSWEEMLLDYAKELCLKYAFDRDEINNWYGICRTMFPIYLDYWAQHPDMVDRTPLMSEQVFCVPYKLPSGRTVYLRGKWDSIDVVGKRIWLMENKTKSDPDEEQIKNQLSFDCQTLLYLCALQQEMNDGSYGTGGKLLSGVRYNVIKRPRQYQGKKETHQEFLTRLKGIIEESPSDFFMRWNVEINSADIEKFKREFLNPAMENLCDDYEWWEYCKNCAHFKRQMMGCQFDYEHRGNRFPDHRNRSFRTPFGCYSALADGGSTEYDNYLATGGSEVGLERVTNLFPELE